MILDQESKKEKSWFALPLMILDPHRFIAMALHVMLGTVIRTISWFVLVDHTRISLLPQVRNNSEHSLKGDTQVNI